MNHKPNSSPQIPMPFGFVSFFFQPHVLSSYPQYSSFRDAVRQIARLEGTRGESYRLINIIS
jgi:hypothetical protein